MIRASLIALLCAAAVSCMDRTVAMCADGRVCSPGTVCVESLDRCVDAERVSSCTGPGDGAQCSTREIAAGVCGGGVCFPVGCGNEIVESGEACDDGNTLDGDGCSATCMSDETCGNGVLDEMTNEECDDGPANNISGAGCRPDCRRHCGDGFVSEAEMCDVNAEEAPSCLALAERFDRGLTTCSSLCRPVLNLDTCKHFGWRVRHDQYELFDLVLIDEGKGFAIAPAAVAPFVDFEPIMEQAHASGGDLNAVWAASADLAVVVGDGGNIARFDGSAWTSEPSGTTRTLHDVWGRDADDIYAVGDAGTVLHYSGGVWSPVMFPVAVSLRGVAGDAAALYVVGDSDTFYRLDGAVWTDVAPGTGEQLRAVWSDGALAVAVGTGGAIAELRGDVVTVQRPVTTDLVSVWGSAEDGFFAVGARHTVLAFDGRGWRRLAPGTGVEDPAASNLHAIHGIPGQGVLGVGGTSGAFTFEGAAWSPTASPTVATLLALGGSAVDDVFAVGQEGAIVHHDGVSWERQDSGTTADLVAVWSASPTLAYAVGDAGTLLRYDGASWSPMDSGTSLALRGVWASAEDDLYVSAGPEGLRHFDGAEWSFVELPPAIIPPDDSPVGTNLGPIWGTSASDVWVFGVEAAGGFHFDGTDWTHRWDAAGAAVAGDESGWVTSYGLRYHAATQTVDWLGFSPGLEFGRAVALDADGGVMFGGPDGQLARWHDGDGIPEPVRSRRATDINAMLAFGDVIFVAGAEGALDTLFFQR